jgi:hypothetical protein
MMVVVIVIVTERVIKRVRLSVFVVGMHMHLVSVSSKLLTLCVSLRHTPIRVLKCKIK